MKWIRPAGENVVELHKPKDWNDANGPCGTLPCRRQVNGVGAAAFVSYFSNWKPDSDELVRLNAGHVIELECCGGQPAVSMAVVPNGDPDPEARQPTRPMEAIRGAVARGWCADSNREKEMDSDLAEAISREVAILLGFA